MFEEHLYLVDHGSTDAGGWMDHVDLLFQDCTTQIVNFCYHIEHIYVHVFAFFVFVIYYDLLLCSRLLYVYYVFVHMRTYSVVELCY